MKIEKLQEGDLPEAARVWHQAGIDEYTYLPAFQALTASEALTIFREQIFAKCEVWVAKYDALVAGVAALDGDTLDRLYVHPSCQRKGVGAELLNHCVRMRPRGIRLFTHQENARARAFYESHGFQAVAFGISPPPESVPDVEYRLGEPEIV